jgi:hypothetical protein
MSRSRRNYSAPRTLRSRGLRRVIEQSLPQRGERPHLKNLLEVGHDLVLLNLRNPK